MQAEVSPPHYDDLFLNWTSTLNHITGIFWGNCGNCLELWNHCISLKAHKQLHGCQNWTNWLTSHAHTVQRLLTAHMYSCDTCSVVVNMESVCLSLCPVRTLKYAADFNISFKNPGCMQWSCDWFGLDHLSSLTITMPYPSSYSTHFVVCD